MGAYNRMGTYNRMGAYNRRGTYNHIGIFRDSTASLTMGTGVLIIMGYLEYSTVTRYP
jgi:hypothetical protein